MSVPADRGISVQHPTITTWIAEHRRLLSRTRPPLSGRPHKTATAGR